MSAASFPETAIVLESRSGAAAGHELDLFLERAPIELAEATRKPIVFKGQDFALPDIEAA